MRSLPAFPRRVCSSSRRQSSSTCKRALRASSTALPAREFDEAKPSSKQRLIQAALKQVHSHGWTQQALLAAVQTEFGSTSSLSLGAQVTPQDLVAHVMDVWNHQLKQELIMKAKFPNEVDNADELTTIPDRIAYAIKRRLEYQRDYVQSRQWHKAMALGATSNALRTSQQLKDLIHTVVEYAMETHQEPRKQQQEELSTTSAINKTNTMNTENLFDKASHLALGAIYAATELHMLTDSSIDYEDTWQFLKHRVDNWYSGRQRLESVLPIKSTSENAILASTVASALASGLQSILMTGAVPLKNNLQLPTNDQVYQMVSAVTSFATATTPRPTTANGTHPSHYDTPSPHNHNTADKGTQKDSSTK